MEVEKKDRVTRPLSSNFSNQRKLHRHPPPFSSFLHSFYLLRFLFNFKSFRRKKKHELSITWVDKKLFIFFLKFPSTFLHCCLSVGSQKFESSCTKQCYRNSQKLIWNTLNMDGGIIFASFFNRIRLLRGRKAGGINDTVIRDEGDHRGWRRPVWKILYSNSCTILTNGNDHLKIVHNDSC